MKKVELYKHNQRTFENIRHMIERGDKRIGIVQPTGTGKSYLIVEVLRYVDTDSVILLSPSNHINSQILSIDAEVFNGKTFMTYAKLSMLKDEEIRSSRAKVIVLDEFHRCGAEVWGGAVQKLLELNPNAIVIGTSATPIRYLDGVKDMGEELFGNNLAVNMTLADAIYSGLLPTPKYVTALYDFTDPVENTRKMIYNSKNSEEEKKLLLRKLEVARNHLEQSNGVPTILEKYFNMEYPKTIVFCKNKEHLNEMKDIVMGWFREAFKEYEIKSYVIQSEFGNGLNTETLNGFKRDDSGIPVLFTINILNEGIHIESVKNLIFLRKSMSPIIVRQQTGRALNVGMDAVPVIFDLVNNIRTMGVKWLSEDVTGNVINLNTDGDRDVPEFDVYDELLDVEKTFSEIESQLIFSWDKYYELLIKFKEKFGNVEVPTRYIEDETNMALGQWLSTQRNRYKSSLLSQEKCDRLRAVGVELDRDYFNDRWDEMYEELVEFYNIHSHILVPNSGKYKVINTWCTTQRADFRRNKLSKERIEKLRDIHFEFDYSKLRFNQLMRLYVEAHSKGINIDTVETHYKGKNLYHWVLKARKMYEENELSDSIVNRLNAIGFQWESRYVSEAERWEILEDWLKSNKIEDLTVYVTHKGYGLGYWYYMMKVKARKNELPDEVMEKLKSVGFSYVKYVDASWEKAIEMYRRYLDEEKLSDKEIAGVKDWIIKQRRRWKLGKLSSEKVAELEKMGFDFSGVEVKTWEESYEIMREYKEEFGHCDVVKGTEYRDYNLHSWVIYQRKMFKKGKLVEEQIERLNEIGFIWDKLVYDWMIAYDILKEYYEEYGHSNPLRGQLYRDFSIGDWVRSQRVRLKNNRLRDGEKELLDQLEFQW